MIGLVAFWAASAAAAGPAVGPHEDIQVGIVALRVPIPAGFCKPTGKDAAVMQLLAASDSRNVTHVSFVECPDTPAHRYLMLKTPIEALNASVALPEMIKSMSEALEQPELIGKLNSDAFNQQVADEKSKVLGTETKVAGEFRPRGHDDVCVYLAGLMTTTVGDATETQAGAACMTVAGNRLISINEYEDTSDPDAYRSLMVKSRELALKIKPVP